jgi:protease II
MTANPVRDTKFASWIDEYAWMEEMKGKKWEDTLKEENELSEKYLKIPAIKEKTNTFFELYSLQKKIEMPPFECRTENKTVFVEYISSFFKSWKFNINGKERIARDIFCVNDGIVVTTDIGNGAEKFQLEYWKFGNEKPVWAIPNVGPDIGFAGNKLYFLGVKNKLIYNKLYSCDLETGKNIKLIYTELFPEVNLAIERQPEGRCLLVRDHSQFVIYNEIRKDGLSFSGNIKRFNIPQSWIIPLGEYGIEFVWESKGLMITKNHGKKTLWRCSPKKSAKKIIEIEAGSILVDPFASWSNDFPCYIRITESHENPVMYLINDKYELQPVSVKYSTGFKIKRFEDKSYDGITVHGAMIYKSSQKIKNILVTGYGAYGIETASAGIANRWYPLLQNGWAVVVTFIRGGGDHTEQWGQVGRRFGRKNSIEDFKALIKKAQKDTGIGPRNTVIYGRSAGGLLVGTTLANNPSGNLMRGVFTEVPYVDLLRTSSNPSLPLTELEYNEFGNPSERLEDFIFNGLYSPVDSAAVTAAPKIFVLARTAENDSQVFTYESIKWIKRLRSHDKDGSAPKLCIIENGQGHFTPPDESIKQWAIDCALLDGWVNNDF